MSFIWWGLPSCPSPCIRIITYYNEFVKRFSKKFWTFLLYNLVRKWQLVSVFHHCAHIPHFCNPFPDGSNSLGMALALWTCFCVLCHRGTQLCSPLEILIIACCLGFVKSFFLRFFIFFSQCLAPWRDYLITDCGKCQLYKLHKKSN